MRKIFAAFLFLGFGILGTQATALSPLAPAFTGFARGSTATPAPVLVAEMRCHLEVDPYNHGCGEHYGVCFREVCDR